MRNMVSRCVDRREIRQSVPLRAAPLTVFVISLLVAMPGLPAQGTAAEGRAQAAEVAQLGGDRQADAPMVRQTRHDLSLDGAEPCRFCHLARQTGTDVKPRWDRQQDVAMYSAYGGAEGSPATKWRPQGVSQVCLSCHDGTIGPDRKVETIVGATGLDPINNPQIGTVYLSDHPVSVAFKGGGREFEVARRGYAGAVPLFGDRKDQVECGSCHNPHYETYGAFLRLATAQGSLCRSCHVK